MMRGGRALALLLLASLAAGSTGCLGLSQNPSYFPHWVPFGDEIFTHAKPPGPSYYANFDPHAVKLEVRPLPGQSITQVRTQFVVLATVYDKDGTPLRNRRVEWMLEGAGNIIEVDESGFLPGRGYKKDSRYAVSYTGRNEHRMSRGNGVGQDDFMLRPGQSWCVISAAAEGDSHLTVYVPGIHNWDQGRKFLTVRWVDAAWEFATPATARAGGEHVFTTRVFKATDRQPLAGYRVRYKILDGPASFFLPGRTTEFTATSDLAGAAQVAIAQPTAAFGTNRVSIEIIRPPDPSAPSGSGVVLAQGETTIQWLAPNIQFNHSGPSSAVLGQEVTYTTTATNAGQMESRSMTITSPIPDGLQYVRSQPPAFVDGKNLVWALGLLPQGGVHNLQAVYKTTRQGTVTCCATMQTEEGQKDEKCVNTQVGVAQLRVGINGPGTGAIGAPITYNITVNNPGSGVLDRIDLTARLDEGLEGDRGVRELNTKVDNLAAGETRTVQLSAIPRRVGKLGCRVTGVSGSLTDQAEHFVVVQQAPQAQANLGIEGPSKRYVGRPVDFNFRVTNPGDTALSNVQVKAQLPPELQFLNAGQNGQQLAGDVVWNLGNLGPREERVLSLSTKTNAVNKQAQLNASLVADGGVNKQAQAGLEIFGLPTLRTEMVDQGDPVEVGKRVTYILEVTNTGTLPASGIEVRAIVPPELKVVAIKGPAAENIAGNIIAFNKVDNLGPNQKLTYTFEMEAIRAGDVRFRAEVRAPTLEAGPAIEEESTTVFDPRANGGNGNPPPPPPPPR